MCDKFKTFKYTYREFHRAHETVAIIHNIHVKSETNAKCRGRSWSA